METPKPADGDSIDHQPDSTLDSILEALLVDDADVVWDPVTGKPRVTRRQKTDLDRPDGNA